MSSLFNKQPEKAPDVQMAATAPATVARAEAPQRSDHLAPADGRAHLDRGTKVSGKLSFDSPAWIDGEVDGEISAKDSVTVGESAVVTAGIRAASVLVAGRVSGNISAAERIELRASARVECDMAAPVIVIQEGAQFEGRCSMRSDGAKAEHKAAASQHQERAANNAPAHKPASSQPNAA